MKIIIGLIYQTLGILGYFFPNLYPNKIILTFHSVANLDWEHNHSIDSLREYLQKLQKLGYEFVKLMDIKSNTYENKKVCAITFDDGYKNLLNIKNLPSEGVECCVFVLAEPLKVNRRNMGNNIELLEYEDIKTLKKSGWQIASHGMRHENFAKMTIDQKKYEIEKSKEILERNIVDSIDSIAIPHGSYDKMTQALVINAGYRQMCTMDDTLLTIKTDDFALPRIGIMKWHSQAHFCGLITTPAIYLRRIFKILSKTFINIV